MTKGRELPSYIMRRKRDGVLFFRKRAGKGMVEVRLETQFPDGDPIPFGLHQERERLLNQPTPVAGGQDMAAVIRNYRASDAFADLKPRTRQDYDKHLPYFTETFGSLHPKNIERHHVITWLNAWAKKETPHKANYRMRVLSIVMEHAKNIGLLTNSDDNPVKGVKSIKYEKQERQPWPQELINAFRATATGQALLVFELALGTGQRIGDVLEMQWGDIDGEGIKVTQNKTNKKLWVPMTANLRTALANTKRRSVFILTNPKATGPWPYRTAARDVRDARKAIGAMDYDIHSLRYTAASELKLAGADDDVIAAVTGQSKAMVIHYTKSVRQKVLALKAKNLRE